MKWIIWELDVFPFPPPILVPCLLSLLHIHLHTADTLFLKLLQLLREQMNLFLFFFKSQNYCNLCLLVQDVLFSYFPCSVAFQLSAMALLCLKSNCKSIYFIIIFNEMKISEVSLLWPNICLRKMKLPLFELMKIKWTASEFNWVSVWIITMVGPTDMFGD